MLIMLWLCTGIHCAEAVALAIGDLVMEQSYHVAIIGHGTGNKRGFAMVAVEVRQIIDDDLEAAGRDHAALDVPLFVSVRKGDHPQEKPLHSNQAYAHCEATRIRRRNRDIASWDAGKLYYTGL